MKQSVMMPRFDAVRARIATDDDIAEITAIYGHYVLTGVASFEIEPPDAVEMGRRRKDIVRRGLPYLVAEIEGKLAGYAYASPYRVRAGYRFTVEDSVFVDREYTGRGIGGMLLGALIEACRERDYRQMIAVIGGSDNAASIRLHENFGFRHAGVLRSVGFKFGRWVDTVLMQRALGESEG
jgi:phosphinothricin acetyltransferase